MATKRKAPRSYTPFSKKLTGSLNRISDTIEDNAKLMDSIQELALELTNSIGTMHKLTVKYAGVANGILDVLSPVLGRLPLIPKKATRMLTDLERITQRVVDGNAKTSRTIASVQSGLKTGNVSKLRGHTNELQGLTRSLRAILPR